MKDNAAAMAKLAYNAISNKKGEDIRIIDIREISVIADYFVIATARNSSQMEALVDAVEEALYKAGFGEADKEGNQRSSWVLLDYKDIIVHIFSKEDRLFYDLDRIWRDGKPVEPEDL